MKWNEFCEMHVGGRKDSSFKLGLQIEMRSKHNKRSDSLFIYLL